MEEDSARIDLSPNEGAPASATLAPTMAESDVKEKMATKPDDHKSGDQRSKPWMSVVGAVGFVFLISLAYALVSWTSSLPAASRTFVALGASAAFLIIMGLTTLIVIIPASAINPDIKTEFFSARAAYICVLAGLILLGIVAIGAMFAQVALALGEF